MTIPFMAWGTRTAGLCLVLVAVTGCSGMGMRAKNAAVNAAADPWTWGPLVGAGAVSAADADRRISDWAKENTPVWGSNDAAQDASDNYRALASSSAWATFLLAGKRGEGAWAEEKAIDTGGNLIGLAVARNTTGLLKPTVHRERPHGGPVHDSFPSAHATDAFAHATMGRYYADDVTTSPFLSGSLKFAMTSFAAATAWGRVEGGVHYPTDVLVAAAIANFSTRFFMDLYAPDGKSGWRVRPRTDEDGNIIIDIEAPL